MNRTFFFFKQKTAYEIRISDLSSDVCSSDLPRSWTISCSSVVSTPSAVVAMPRLCASATTARMMAIASFFPFEAPCTKVRSILIVENRVRDRRSEEHTSELQSLMRISYAVFCLKKKKQTQFITKHHISLL